MIASVVPLLITAVTARRLWSSSPAAWSDVIRQAYPIGNSKLGALQFGDPGSEKYNLNIDSLWSGGPFQESGYTGGNPSEAKYHSLPGIRDFIFQNGIGSTSY